jgi:hypothetical protein
MLLKMNHNSSVLNLRRHSPEMVSELRRLLAGGVPARPDPHRANFYELDGGAKVFYIYVSPRTSNVTLLAVWQNERRPQTARQESVSLTACCAPTG